MQNLAEIWNQEEINYLYENVGAVNLNTIAKKLERPIQGVQTQNETIKNRKHKRTTWFIHNGFISPNFKRRPKNC